jgi:metal-responsive CopG/Arc/MetJ family transcriptional regulator
MPPIINEVITVVQGTIRTTIAFRAELLKAADRAVKSGKVRSRNDLVVAALRRELAAQERAAIDAAFAHMADDAEYLAKAQAIADEFAQADWEAFQYAERTE